MHNTLLKRLGEALLLVLAAFGVFIFLSLISYHATDPAWSVKSSHIIQNLAGSYGAYTADIVLSFFGFFGYITPFVLVLLAWALINGNKKDGGVKSNNSDKIDWLLLIIKIMGCFLILLSGSGLSDIFFSSFANYMPQGSGGIIGSIFHLSLFPKLSVYGSVLLLLAFLMIGATLLTGVSWGVVSKWLLRTGYINLKKLLISVKLNIKKIFESKNSENSEHKDKIANINNNINNKREINIDNPKLFSWLKNKILKTIRPNKLDKNINNNINRTNPVFNVNDISNNKSANKSANINNSKNKIFNSSVQDVIKDNTNLENKIKNNDIKKSVIKKTTFYGGVPKFDLLDKADSIKERMSEKALSEQAAILEQKLADFRIDAKVVGVSPGPVVTRFECQLAPGVKVSKLAGLSKDLARSLSAISVRIVEVIPGKPYVGIELPNEIRQMVRLREILESETFRNSSRPLTIALGKSISGNAAIADLAKMPHLLVAGTTGSGKSVGINAMIISLLYRCSPDQLRMIMIDPKMLELSVYEGIPHLLTPVVTQMNEAANSLRWCVKEMDRRYHLMSLLGVRNLDGMNDKIKKSISSNEPLTDPLNPNEVLSETLPYIVVIIDEFADMMMTVGKKVEDLIARLAQKARAAGIHLVLATQRPSVDVITGLIKANIPTRIAFQVSSKIDSRTILDQQGADQLLGNGDMLYLPPGVGVPTRVHGAFVDDHEVHQVANAWKKRGEPEYIEDIIKTIDVDDKGGDGSGSSNANAESDPLYDEAVKIVVDTQRASISGVQRRLKIGYNRAARLIEQMEEAGLVGPMQQSGLREVIVTRKE
jgi:DNA segregation ATPase FtsK/SpoIIIE, S-DNA-T family